MAAWEADYIRKQGVTDYGIAMLVFYGTYQKYYKEATNIKVDTQLTEEEQNFLNNAIIRNNTSRPKPSRTLIILLVESFESWAIDYCNSSGDYAMPHIRTFIASDHTFYADKVTSQVKYGNSGDGQLLVLTGLLPITSGAACRLYGKNTYPNYAHYFPYSITINPSAGAWNQAEINPRYGITELYESGSISNDSLVLCETLKTLATIENPSMILAITISSHAPFSMAKQVGYVTEPEMPDNMSNYLKCMHYFDSQFGWFVDSLKSSTYPNDIDMLITGDHTIFKKMMLEEMKEYAIDNNIQHLCDGENYCPLIIRSNDISHNIQRAQVCYQMDIYPTISSVIGVQPEWKGFGINILSIDSIRTISVEESESLSDKLIRTNYFESRIENNVPSCSNTQKD